LKLETSTKCSEAKVSDIPKISDFPLLELKNFKKTNKIKKT
jgi:hypothetical protein